MKLVSYHKYESLPYPVYLGHDLWNVTEGFIQPYIMKANAFLLADRNTFELCMPVIQEYIPAIGQVPAFILPPGEASKEPAQLRDIWKWLMASGASGNSLLINLGGGVVSDIGGFAAATFSRGMNYINIPTSLVGQVDAGIGGKTGINIDGVKNQAGLFYDPLAVFIIPDFLKTLPDAQNRSGFAEIVKCAALSGNGAWERVRNASFTDKDELFNLSCETALFKCNIVAADPYDQSTRKALNFGHTVGHALEGFFIGQGRKDFLHGDAVAAGMICEAWISHETAGLPEYELDDITEVLVSFFHPDMINKDDYDLISSLINFDKKKTGTGIGYSLLERFGKPVTGRTAGRDMFDGSLDYFNSVISR